MKTSIKLLLAIVIMSAVTIVACEKADLLPSSPVASTQKKRPTPPPTIVWTEVVNSNVNMHITADTTACGVLILHWDAQPSCQRYTIYDLNAPTSCWPSNTTTNVWYYQYGWGCNYLPSSTISSKIVGEYADSANAVMYKYSSTVQLIQTGRGQWNCN